MVASIEILLVEDDPGIRDSVAEVLAAEGYGVRLAADGEEGLRALDERRPALVVLDLVMPVMNGAEFIAAVRADPRHADLPIVLMTAASSSGGLGLPAADAYLPKPFELTALLDVVEQHARLPRPRLGG